MDRLIVPDECKAWMLAQRSEPRRIDDYVQACHTDFEAMRPYLLKGDVLDIGCGIGGPSALIARFCGGHLHLVDGTGDGVRKVGYGQSMAPYNDRGCTESLLRANQVNEFTWWPVGASELPTVDNVVSLISWGWHYPVETYLEAVVEAMPIGSRLILDLRPGQGGDAVLREHFEYVASYQGFGKCNKTVWRRR